MTRKLQLVALMCTSALFMPVAAFGQGNQAEGEPSVKIEEGAPQAQTSGQQPAQQAQDQQSQTGQAASPQQQSAADAGMAPTAQEFVDKAAVSNRFEIESSELAREKSENAKVQDFAQRMIDDHGAAGEKLKQTAESAEAEIQLPDSLDQQHQQKIDRLSAAEGAQFDRQYVDMQVEGHEKAVQLYSSYAGNGDNAELQQFARTTLPTLEGHLQMIRDISRDPALVAAGEGQDQPATAMQTTEGDARTSDMQTTEGDARTSDMQTAERDAQSSGQLASDDAAKQQALGSISAEELQGTTVYGSSDESIGEVDDIVLATDGRIEAIVVNIGGFLGIGDKPVAIPLSDLEVQKGENDELTLRVNSTEEELEAAPAYEGQQ